jgi:hypothetical protein
MPKITNVRERVHQPFRDSLIRTAGMGLRATGVGQVEDTTKLFIVAGKGEGETNLPQGSVLPSDQSMVVLCLRAFVWYRNAIERGGTITLADGETQILASNGDYALPEAAGSAAFGAALNGQAIGSAQDVLRLYWQTEESLFWSFGAGDKFSITSMPTAYFPYGGGIHGELGSQSDLLLMNNGMPSHEAILRLARAILIPPRQNIRCEANIVSYDDGGNSQVFQATQGWRNMLSLRDNLRAVDLINKVVTFTFDGLFSRDVQ